MVDGYETDDWIPVPQGRVRVEPTGIIHVVMNEGAEVDQPTARAIAATLDELASDPVPLLVDISGIAWTDREGREIFASATHASARALLVSSAPARAVGRLFQALHDSRAETRLFTDEAEARAWLSGFLD